MTDDLTLHIKQCKQSINLSESLERLTNNVDFKNIILKNYFMEVPVSITKQLITCSKGSEEYNQLITQLDAISCLNAYLNTIMEEGQVAKADLEEALTIPDREI